MSQPSHQPATDTQMHSQVIAAYGKPLESATADLPEPKAAEVRVRVTHCGVCHSDVHLHDGYFDLGGGNQLDLRRPDPLVLGHEIEGVVEAIGPDVRHAAVGDRRVVYPWIGCAECQVCQSDNEHICATNNQLGITKPGGYATHCLVPHERYLLNCDGIAPGLAATYMCSGLTAYAAVMKLKAALRGRPCLLIGLGGVGMMGLQFAQELLDGPILAADVDAQKLQAAKGAGAHQVYQADEKDIAAKIMSDAQADGGVAAVLDFVGSEATLGLANGVVARGGQIVIVGLFGGAFQSPIPMFPLRAYAIGGSFVGSLGQAKTMLQLVQAGKIKPIPIETRPLGKATQTLSDLRAGKILGRVVLTP